MVPDKGSTTHVTLQRNAIPIVSTDARQALGGELLPHQPAHHQDLQAALVEEAAAGGGGGSMRRQR